MYFFDLKRKSYKHTCDTIYHHFQCILTISMVLDFLLLHLFTHPPPIHPYFYLSIFVFTRPNDGLCIKLCIIHNMHFCQNCKICDFGRGMTHAVNSLDSYFCDSYIIACAEICNVLPGLHQSNVSNDFCWFTLNLFTPSMVTTGSKQFNDRLQMVGWSWKHCCI